MCVTNLHCSVPTQKEELKKASLQTTHVNNSMKLNHVFPKFHNMLCVVFCPHMICLFSNSFFFQVWFYHMLSIWLDFSKYCMITLFVWCDVLTHTWIFSSDHNVVNCTKPHTDYWDNHIWKAYDCFTRDLSERKLFFFKWAIKVIRPRQILQHSQKSSYQSVGTSTAFVAVVAFFFIT